MEQVEESRHSRKFVLILITIATFLNPFTGTAVNLALPAIGAEFVVDATTLAWVSSAYLLASVIFLLPAGKLGDSRGRVTVFMTGIAIYTAGTVLSVFTPSIGMLLLFRFIQGIGGAMLYANSMALITHLYPPGERGYAIGLNITAVYAALSLGPFLGGILTQFFGWRSIFVVTAAIAAPLLFSGSRFPAFLNDRHREDFDIPGLVLSSALILCLFLGLARANTPGGVVLLAAAIVLGVAFYRVERRRASPLLPVSLLTSNRVFAASNAAALINYSSTYAIGFLLSLYLQYIRGYEPAAAGTLLLALPAIQIFIAPVAGRLADRIRPGLVAASGMALSAVCFFGLATLSETTPVTGIIALLAILGIGVGFFSSPNTTAVMGSVERRHYGSASAMVAMMRSLGMMMGMGMILVVFAFLMGSTVVTPAIFPEFLRSVNLILLAFAVLSVLGAFLSLRKNE